MISEASSVRSFSLGDTIIRAEEPASALFLIEDGSVDYYILTADGRKILLQRLSVYDCFGVAAFLYEPIGYLGTAEAALDVRVRTWDHQAVKRFASKYPRLADNALRVSLQAISLYARRHVTLVTDSAQERVVSALTKIGARSGHVLSSGIEILIKNEDLASLADVGFFTVSRILQKWQRSGAIHKTRGKVVIRAPEKMLAA